MKYESLNRASAKEIREIISDALVPVLKEHNLELEQGNLTFCEDYLKFSSFTIKVIGGKNQAFRDLENYLKVMDIDLDTDKTASISGENCKLVGYKYRSQKYPFIIQFDNGKKAKITEQTAKLYFSK